MRVAAFGGPYSNPYALEALLADARRRGCQRIFCLGDLGGFGAEPEALWGLLVAGGVSCIAGNYDVAVGRGGPDCGCGYRHPEDNAYAQIAYDYTLAHVSAGFAAWMRDLPTQRREVLGGVEVHMVHGSPLGLNDFFWESATEADARRRAEASGAGLVLCTHTGLPWQRQVGHCLVVNVGALGRPANDGRREVWYAVVDLTAGKASAELVPRAYDWAAQAASMRAAGLPEAFAETIETGWWASCLQVLPPDERSRGLYQVYRSELAAGQDDDGLGAARPAGPGPAGGSRRLPVVELFGTALLPRRLWLAGGAVTGGPAPATTGDEVGLRAEAAVAGFVEVRGWAGPTPAPARPAELTWAPHGWFRDPSLTVPLAGPDLPLAEAKRLVVRQVLAERDRLRPYSCVPAEPAPAGGTPR
ncbi:MAG: metallophosphoesterase family protein [Acidimicrobiales bacterium]